MTSSEALVFLNAEKLDDLQDAYNELLFHEKQFFLLKPCIPKVYLSKLRKIDLFIEAAQVLEIEQTELKNKTKSFEISEEDTLLNHFRKYSEVLKELKKDISSCTTFFELKQLVEVRLDLFHLYASKWPLFEEFKEKVKLGSEHEVVAFFEELKHLERLGITTFASLMNSEASLGLMVKKESTRLYCLHNSN